MNAAQICGHCARWFYTSKLDIVCALTGKKVNFNQSCKDFKLYERRPEQ